MERMGIFCISLVVLFSFVGAHEGPGRPTERSSSTLLAAFNTALMKSFNAGDYNNLAKVYNNSFFGAWDCNSRAVWAFPNASEIEKEGMSRLRDIIASKTISVASVAHINMGNLGDYTVAPPTGFFPEMLTKIIEKIAVRYKLGSISINRTYFDSISKSIEAVHLGDAASIRVDMTEPFVPVMALDSEKNPIVNKLESACAITCAYTSFVTRTDDDIFPEALNASSKVAVLTDVCLEVNRFLLPAAVTDMITVGTVDALLSSVRDSVVKAALLTMKVDKSKLAGLQLKSTPLATIRTAFFRADRDIDYCAQKYYQ